MADYDRRLVDLYDEDNPDGPDHDFYRALADELDAHAVVDLGCGTGMLTVSLARGGRTVVGVDPSSTMLDLARSRPGSGAVDWRHGDSRAIPAGRFDYAVMTGNVAQHVPEADWARTLADLAAALRSGGVLAFESRNPAARAWETWTTAPTTRPTVHGPLVEWSEAEQVAPGVVRLVARNAFPDGETVTEELLLHFRGRDEIERDLTAAGFEVEAVYGDWARGPLTETSAVMVVVARAR
ncbi:class I SAM-dependent methyltransferase [Nocardioides alkalitolerans]|uniref:class I SAM-dependent methyltransferase n=1 Tax=Nocardioides alkalitolerans TaxID=281714 RepID=UPI000411E0C8|nr:class I SAM-dependent methyltransferase [Nocardioides alkalitolerans]